MYPACGQTLAWYQVTKHPQYGSGKVYIKRAQTTDEAIRWYTTRKEKQQRTNVAGPDTAIRPLNVLQHAVDIVSQRIATNNLPHVLQLFFCRGLVEHRISLLVDQKQLVDSCMEKLLLIVVWHRLALLSQGHHPTPYHGSSTSSSHCHTVTYGNKYTREGPGSEQQG